MSWTSNGVGTTRQALMRSAAADITGAPNAVMITAGCGATWRIGGSSAQMTNLA